MRRGCKVLKNAEASTEYNREVNAKMDFTTITNGDYWHKKWRNHFTYGNQHPG